MTRKVLDLSSLGVDNIGEIGKVVINEIFVADVDERAEVSNGSSDEREAPERDEFDQPVRNEC